MTYCKRRFTVLQEHLFHCTDHELLPIEDNLTPERFEVERCQIHSTHVLNEICKLCKKQFCKRCDAKENCMSAIQDMGQNELNDGKYPNFTIGLLTLIPNAIFE